MSNTRKVTRYCAEAGCAKTATVEVSTFNDDGTNYRSRWVCRAHAVAHAHSFKGKVWGDARCGCGAIDQVLDEAGRTKIGDL